MQQGKLQCRNGFWGGLGRAVRTPRLVRRQKWQFRANLLRLLHRAASWHRTQRAWLGGAKGRGSNFGSIPSPSIRRHRHHAGQHHLSIYLGHARLALAREAKRVVDHHRSALGCTLEQARSCWGHHLLGRSQQTRGACQWRPSRFLLVENGKFG